MAIEITVRHLNVGESLQQYAQSKAERLIEAFPKTEFVHVILDHERHQYCAEFVVQHKGQLRLEAEDRQDDMIKAIDNSMDKIERQLRKHRDKMVDHYRA